MSKILISFLFLTLTINGFSQKSSKSPIFFAEPIMIDSSSTVIIPTKYDSDLLSSSKLAIWNSFYANIIFYDFNTDNSKRLFKDDTFIKSFTNQVTNYRYDRNTKNNNISSNWVFYFVTQDDFNKSGKIDNDDPSVLYVSDKKGNGLQALTPTNENAVSIEVYDKQGFALVKMQRDADGNGNFEFEDKDYYYVRLDLKTLSLGNKIEIK